MGYPSAGKSSLIAAISAARPKIADYPFTTLIPNLGVVQAGDVRYTVADVPGLIEGASEGRGLGHRFLRHVERSSALVHVIDCATLEPGRDPISDFEVIRGELQNYEVDPTAGVTVPLHERPQIVVLNKIDVPEARELAEFVRPEFEEMGFKVFEISTASHEGLKPLIFAMAKLVEEDRAARAAAEKEAARVTVETPVIRPKGFRNKKKQEFVIRREERNLEPLFRVIGEKPERWIQQTDFNNDEAVGYLADRLARLGVEDELFKAGARAGDAVVIGFSTGNRLWLAAPSCSLRRAVPTLAWRRLSARPALRSVWSTRNAWMRRLRLVPSWSPSAWLASGPSLWSTARSSRKARSTRASTCSASRMRTKAQSTL